MVRNDDVPSFKKYGVPLYSAAWLPTPPAVEDSDSPPTPRQHVLLAGGGGAGSSGIPNALLVSAYDYGSNSLSDQPVEKVGTASDLPYRIAVHPGGEGIMCSFPESCRWFEFDGVTNPDQPTLRSSEKVFEKLENVGQQMAMTFNNEGSVLAVGGEDGKLRVFKWPSMETILDDSSAHSSVKGLDFSLDGKFLVSVGSGHGRVWDVSTSTSIASLSKINDENFGFCRFSQTTDSDQVLYVTSMQDNGGSIVKWNTTTWRRISSARVVRDSISSFSVSADGKLLAVGTIDGDITIVSSASMRVQTVVKKAHMGFVTALAFSQDSRALVSGSMDSSARAMLTKDLKETGTSLWMILLVLLLAVAAAYYTKSNELFKFP